MVGTAGPPARGRTVLVCAPCGKTARYSPMGLVRPPPPPGRFAGRSWTGCWSSPCATRGGLAGAVFLLAPDGLALRLEVAAGLPAEYLTPWSRVALSSPVPVREALRQRRLV
jgi:hypothetical protein